MKNKTKKILLIVLAVLLVLAAGGGVWYYLAQKNAEPVYVFPFEFVGMTEYWGDNQESYGPVSTDRIQTVYISETQTVTQVHVEPGTQVKKGDLLISFDTTLSDLALERKRLDVEKLKLQLLDAEEYLKELKNMRPMRVPQVTPDDESEEKLGALLTEQSQVSFLPEYDGSSADKALILWVRSDAKITDAMLEEAWSKAVEFQTANRPEEPEDPEGEGGEGTGAEPVDPPDPDSGESGSSSGTEGETPPPPEGGEDGGNGDGGEGSEEEEEGEEEGPVEVKNFYVVIKVTASNRELGNKSVWQGLHVYRNGGDYSFQFFSAPIPDHMLTETDDTDKPDFDYGSGYTWAQLQQMRADQEKKIADLRLQVRMAEAEYKLKQLEAADGHVYAKFDGTVVSLLTPEEAKATSQPMLKVSGGGGFYVEGFVSELQREQLTLGQEVTVNDWNTGMV